MSNETAPAVPLFSLKSTTNVDFTSTQLLTLALAHLRELGHEFDEDTVKSTFNTKGMSITVETVEGDKPAKKPRRAAKKVTKKAPPKETKEEAKPETETTTEPETTPEVDKGHNPFPAATVVDSPTDDSNESTIAAVKEDAGVDQNPAFSTDTADIQSSDSGEAPDFDFSQVGQ